MKICDDEDDFDDDDFDDDEKDDDDVNCCIIVSYIKIIYTQFSIFDVSFIAHGMYSTYVRTVRT